MRSFSLPSIPTPASTICLGCGGYGTAQTEDEAFALMDAFAERGGNFFDTAHVYANWVAGGAGASEKTLGRWVKSRGVRDTVVIGTKGAHPKLETMHIPRMSAGEIAGDIADSLGRLQTDHIDLYWLHRDGPSTPAGEILDTLGAHIAAGTIRAIGASNWLPARLAEAAAYAARTGVTGFCASQISWSLAHHAVAYDPVGGMAAMDDNAMAYYLQHGPRNIPYSAQANGFFAHPYASAAARMAHYASPINKLRHQRAQQFAETLGRSPNAIALAYILNHPAGGAGIAAPRTLAQLADTCSAADITLSADQQRWLVGG